MTLDSALNVLLVVGVVLGGMGYALGQFVSQKRKGAGDALRVALDEVEALRIRSDRLERELGEVREELVKLHTENRTLRDLLAGGTFLAEQIRVLVSEEVGKGNHAVLDAMRQEGLLG